LNATKIQNIFITICLVLEKQTFPDKLVGLIAHCLINPKTVFWTHVGKIVLIYFYKILPLI